MATIKKVGQRGDGGCSIASTCIFILLVFAIIVCIAVYNDQQGFRLPISTNEVLNAGSSWSASTTKSISSSSSPDPQVLELAKQLNDVNERLSIKLDNIEAKMSSIGTGNRNYQNGETQGEKDLKKSRRKFVSYVSSPWEQLWLENVHEWSQDQSICKVLLEDQSDMLHQFLALLCSTAVLSEKWCRIDDPGHKKPMYYNQQNRTSLNLTFERPADLEGVKDPPFHQVWPGEADENIVSKFVFLDELEGKEYVEYIEPLVGHLRHPLSHCIPTGNDPKALMMNRGFILPPPYKPRDVQNLFYFDIGTSTWSNDTPSSIRPTMEMWELYGLEFDRIQVYSMTASPKTFYESVPPKYQSKTIFRQCIVASFAEEESLEHPFVPHEIERIAKEDDYVFLKLDIGSTQVEEGVIQYILKNNVKVDEIAWEHHVEGNYLMKEDWDSEHPAQKSLRESYNYFLSLRQKGIRAHSWV